MKISTPGTIRSLARALLFIVLLFGTGQIGWSQSASNDLSALKQEFQNPPREFTLLPFWFWNDTLTEKEIVRQIDDFEKHGVYGFTIHPRIGLPQDTGWMSPKMLQMMRVALQEAARRKMYVMLYDDGMYPSGSASGQVVAENPEYAARGFVKMEIPSGAALPKLEKGAKLVTVIDRPNGARTAIYDMFSKGFIRGIHFVGAENIKNPREEQPAAADLLNPKAVQCFIRLVYQRYYDEFKPYFNGTIVGIFTDEPSILGRGARRGIVEGNSGSLPEINKILGYDFTPFLPELWNEKSTKRKEFKRAVEKVLEETYYGQISDWCRRHNVAFAGHPALSSDMGILRKMDIPGQDIVWRYIEPGEKAFDPTHSMMAKVASSAMLHSGKRRNLNEVFGAYGHNFTFEEMKWIANWCFVRGHNMLLPHAFFYSIRGPRRDERPPDVGPNSTWWNKYKTFADCCSRLSWLNTDSTPQINVAILTESHQASAEGTQSLFEHQIDFSYLEFDDLTDRGTVSENGVALAGMQYKICILPRTENIPEQAKAGLEKLAKSGRLIRFSNQSIHVDGATVAERDADLVKAIAARLPADIVLTPASNGIRVRHVVKKGTHFYILFNEIDAPAETRIALSVKGAAAWWNPETGKTDKADLEKLVQFRPFELKILAIEVK